MDDERRGRREHGGEQNGTETKHDFKNSCFDVVDLGAGVIRAAQDNRLSYYYIPAST